MRDKRGETLWVTILLVLAFSVFAALLWAAEEEKEGRETEVKVTLDQVPAAVKATIEKEGQGAKVEEIEKETEDGKTVYSVEFLKGKEKSEIEVAEDGKVLAREAEVSLDQVPAAVKAAIEKEGQGAKVEEIEKETVDGKTVYSVEFIKEKTEIEVAEDGKVLKRETEEDDDDEGDEQEVKVSLDQVPAAVKAAIEKESQGSEVKEIEKETEDGKTVYSVEFLKGKEKSEIEVAEDGKVLKRETEEEDDDDEDEGDEQDVKVSLDQVPAAVKASIEKESQGARIEEIEKETADGKTVYSVEFIKERPEIEVAEDGKVLKRETDDEDDDGEEDEQDVKVSLDQVPAAVKATLEKESQGARIEEIEKETEDGKTVYSVEILKGKEKSEIEISEDGKVLKRETEEDEANQEEKKDKEK